ncbi:hypothetical protein BE221DRAFT_2190, partial [Ostreococcus tauri]
MLAKAPPPVARRTQELPSKECKSVDAVVLDRYEVSDEKGDLRQRLAARRHRRPASEPSRDVFRIHRELEKHRQRGRVRPQYDKLLMRMPHAPRKHRQSHQRERRDGARERPRRLERSNALRPGAHHRPHSALCAHAVIPIKYKVASAFGTTSRCPHSDTFSAVYNVIARSANACQTNSHRASPCAHIPNGSCALSVTTPNCARTTRSASVRELRALIRPAPRASSDRDRPSSATRSLRALRRDLYARSTRGAARLG